MDRATPSPRIAIVEDDESLLRALSFALEADRYQVATYRTARDTLERCRDCQCLVVDLGLPDLDGLTLIEGLRSRGVTAPAILVTTAPDARCRRRAAAANVPIVEKPLLSGELAARIAAAVGR
jgi:DNA-binding response OmpR family regulator